MRNITVAISSVVFLMRRLASPCAPIRNPPSPSGAGWSGIDDPHVAEHLLDLAIDKVIVVAEAMRADVADHPAAGARDVVAPGVLNERSDMKSELKTIRT